LKGKGLRFMIKARNTMKTIPRRSSSRNSRGVPASGRQRRDHLSAERVPPQKKRPAFKRRKYRLLPIVIAGMLIFLFLLLLAGFVWAIITYSLKGTVTEAVFIPGVIFFAAVFLAALVLSYALRGRYLLPLIIFALVLSVITLFFSGIENVYWVGFIIKTAAAAGICVGANALVLKTSLRAAEKNRRGGQT
jgi:uncharacterized membrane protein